MVSCVRCFVAIFTVIKKVVDSGEHILRMVTDLRKVNLAFRDVQTPVPWWGRVIFHVPDVDAVYDLAMAHGFAVEAEPRDAPWGERYFHVLDPSGHQLSFAKPL